VRLALQDPSSAGCFPQSKKHPSNPPCLECFLVLLSLYSIPTTPQTHKPTRTTQPHNTPSTNGHHIHGAFNTATVRSSGIVTPVLQSSRAANVTASLTGISTLVVDAPEGAVACVGSVGLVGHATCMWCAALCWLGWAVVGCPGASKPSTWYHQVLAHKPSPHPTTSTPLTPPHPITTPTNNSQAP